MGLPRKEAAWLSHYHKQAKTQMGEKAIITATLKWEINLFTNYIRRHINRIFHHYYYSYEKGATDIHPKCAPQLLSSQGSLHIYSTMRPWLYTNRLYIKENYSPPPPPFHPRPPSPSRNHETIVFSCAFITQLRIYKETYTIQRCNSERDDQRINIGQWNLCSLVPTVSSVFCSVLCVPSHSKVFLLPAAVNKKYCI